MAGKKIFAEPGTVTGSIGVFGMKLVTGGLENWGGMKTEVVARGKNSGANSTTFEWSESERQALTETVEEVYAQFIDKALAGRKAAGKDMTREELVKLAGGRVWTGRQAKANGLVDELGTLDDAIAEAKKQAGIDPKTEMELLTLPKPVSFLDKLMEGDIDVPFLSKELKQVPGAAKALKMAGPLLRTQKDPAKVMLPFVVEWK
jgi:protease-4